MITNSLWQTFEDSTYFPVLTRSIEVDVAVIGGGITGITTAQLLSEQGFKVAVLESLKVGVSNTGHSTGNLYEVMGKDLVQIRKKYSPKVVEQIVSSRRSAMNLIEENIRKFSIDCDFKKVPWTYYTSVEEMKSFIEKEHKLAQEINLPLEFTELNHPSLKSIKAVRIEGQAQFNPLRYVQGLAKAIANEDCQIYEYSKVMDVDHQGDQHILKTEEGTVTAKYVVHATHTPKGVMTYHMLLEPYREYGIACKVSDPQHPEGIYFGYYNISSHYSTRFYERNGQRFLIVVGSPHKVGHDDSHEHLIELEKFAREHFNVLEVTHRWGDSITNLLMKFHTWGRRGIIRTFLSLPVSLLMDLCTEPWPLSFFRIKFWAKKISMRSSILLTGLLLLNPSKTSSKKTRPSFMTS